MNDVTVSGLLFDGGPSMVEIEDESSLWFVRDELRELYLVSVGSMTRRRMNELRLR